MIVIPQYLEAISSGEKQKYASQEVQFFKSVSKFKQSIWKIYVEKM